MTEFISFFSFPLNFSTALNPQYERGVFCVTILLQTELFLTLCKSNLLIELNVENSLETAIKFNPYCTSKKFYKIFCKDYNRYKETIFINNERFWRKKPTKERNNFKK